VAQVSEASIEKLVFGDARGVNAVVEKLEATLRIKVDEWCRLCGANDVQRAKLELAGRVDIGRFLERVDDLKRQAPNASSAARANDLYQKAERLRMSLSAGFFDDDSMFTKTARNVISRKQVVRAERVSKAAQHRAQIAPSVALLKDDLKLTDLQAQALVDLLLAETLPPRRPGAFSYPVTLFEMQRLSESQLKPLFNDQQWDLLKRQFDQVKWLQPQLKQEGFLREN
jgi:hypothetical protein